MDFSEKNDTTIKAPIARMSLIAPSLDQLSSIKYPKKEDVEAFSHNILEPALTNEKEVNHNPKIPDGGWGWVVVFATFILCMVADGVGFSFGLLYKEFLIEFEASNSATSWIGGLFMSVPLLTGPIMSGLVDKFGCRSMTIAGSVISALGFILSSKCYSINFMYITFGIITGLGLGLIYVTVVVSVAFWFDKKRTLAFGIGSAGIGIGTFVFSPLCSYLIAEYGWRGTTLILGGIFLNMCVCGTLMKDPDWIIEQDKQNEKSTKTSKNNLNTDKNLINIEELKALLTNEKNYQTILRDLETSFGNNEDKNKLEKYFQSTLTLPTFMKQHEKVPIEVLELLSTNKNLKNSLLRHYPSLFLNNTSQPEENNQIIRSPSSNQFKRHHHEANEPFIRKNSTHHHENYFKNLKIDKHSMITRGAVFNTSKYKFKASSCPNIYRVSMVSIPKETEEKWYSEFVDIIKDMFDYSLFLELHFFLLSLSTITFFTWFVVPYFYIVELMTKEQYTDEQASFTISNMGISNTVGMIFLGWAGDQPWMNITKTYAIFLVICGISIAGQMYFLHNFIMLQICSSLFGIALSSHFAFTPGIVMELVQIDRFTIAYGLQLLCQGIGTLVGPPYAGLLFDLTLTWEQSFYQAAIYIILSGICVGTIPYIKNRKIIGKGPVEKEVENSKNHWISLISIFILITLCIIIVIYLTTVGVQVYLNRSL